MSLDRDVGADTKELYSICQSFDVILKKKKKQGNKKIQFSSQDDLSDGRDDK